jgi:pimeloyl-ACP methyl ester carboxylesterase
MMMRLMTGMFPAVIGCAMAIFGPQIASGTGSAADILYASPGQMVSVDGSRLNLYCAGSGSPTVVFDSGFLDWAPAWSTVQPQIAKWTRACSYDRAGVGFSDAGPMPRTSVRIAGELHTALHRAGIAGPYILVGHAFGGDNVRTFAGLYMHEVAGLVLVDADATDLEPKWMQEEDRRGRGELVSQLRACRNAIAEHKPLPSLGSGPGESQRTCAQQLFFRGLPEVAWSAELNAKLLQIAQTKISMYDAYASEMEQMTQDESYLQQHGGSFGSRPLRVLTSGNHGVPADDPDHVKYQREIARAQARWLALSSNSKQVFAHTSSEYIQFDDPDTVIKAIREVYDQASQPPPRVVELKASDGALLKATYFAAAKPGPGVLLLHQSNRTRESWDELALQLSAAGLNALTLDMRGFGDSGSPYAKMTDAQRSLVRDMWPRDVDTAWQYLASRPGVDHNVIGVAGAGWFGVLHAVEAARQHPAEVRALALLSGETLQDGLQFLRQATQLPELFVVADDDEYPPTVEAMELLYITASNPGKKFVHYSAAHEAGWVWYETADADKVPATGGHGTDLFKVHPDLAGTIVNWFVTTLIETPGHAPADTVASAPILDRIREPGGVARVTQQLMAARRQDPQVQLWPEVTVDIIGSDHARAGEIKEAIELFKLNLLAYPDSADAHGNLAEAYLKDGQRDMARQLAEQGMALLDSHDAPSSSWSDTQERRGEVRSGLLDILKNAGSAP